MFKITSSPSYFSDRKFQEFVNPTGIRKILESNVLDDSRYDEEDFWGEKTRSYKGERDFLNALLSNINSRIQGGKDGRGFHSVGYKTLSSTPDVGRVYPDKALSVGQLWKPVRHFLLCDHYTDIDIKNAHPEIAFQIFSKAGIVLSSLKDYTDNRDTHLQKVMQEYDVTRDEAKTLFIRLMYGGSFSKWASDVKAKHTLMSEFIKGYNTDCKVIIAKIAEANPDWIEKYQTRTLPRSTVCSIFFQNWERLVLETIFKVLVKNKFISCRRGKDKHTYRAVLCYDGIMIPKDHEGDLSSVLEKCVESIRTDHNLSLVLEVKPMTEGFTVDQMEAVGGDILNPRPLGEFHLGVMMSKVARCDSLIEEKMRGFDEKNMQVQKKIKREVMDLECDANRKSYNQMKVYFEQYHFFNQNPVSFVRIYTDRLQLMTNAEFNVTYENVFLPYDEGRGSRSLFIDWWKKDVSRRSHMRLEFAPPPIKCHDEIFNTFLPFVITEAPRTETRLSPVIREHIWRLTGKNDLGVEYMLNWLAHMIQKPGEVPGVAILLKSIPGVGKDLFARLFANGIMGRHYYLNTKKMADLTGSFPVTPEKILITLNEASGKDTFSGSDDIKEMITRVRELVNSKHVKQYEINSCARFMFFSNNETPIKIELHDRRFQVFECDSEMANNPEYIRRLISEMEDTEVLRGFYQFLMARDISKWNATLDRVTTDLFIELQQVNVPIIYNFLDDYLRSFEDMIITVSGGDIYNAFKGWCIENNMGVKNGVASSQKFGRWLGKVSGVEKHHTSRGSTYWIHRGDVAEGSPLT